MSNIQGLKHLAVIMDGNGRWAREKGLSTFEGHKAGVDAAKRIIELSIKYEIKNLTLYAFSIENWGRPFQEVRDILHILETYLDEEAERLNSNGIKISFLGEIETLPKILLSKIKATEDLTKNNKVLNLNIALSYSGKVEILNACRKIVDSGVKSEEIDENLFKKHLYISSMPDVDLLIRTSGEQRISNFLLWQIAYSELYFSKVYWPDFNEQELLSAMNSFTDRVRTFGIRKSYGEK